MSNQQPYVQPGELLNDFLRSFWQRQVDSAENETPDYRHPPLPLARIKKVMKSDPDVKMIAADGIVRTLAFRNLALNYRFPTTAPILFCKACEIFIAEITARAFIVADSNKRRTLSRADIAKALSKSDQFDFLIDIVPREESNFPAATGNGAAKRVGTSSAQKDQTSQSGVGDGPAGSMELDTGNGTTRSGSEVLEQLESLLGTGNPRPLS